MRFFVMDDATAHGTDGSARLRGVDPTLGSPGSFAAVIDALAAERGAPRAEIIRRMVEELENRIAVDRATIALLRRV